MVPPTLMKIFQISMTLWFFIQQSAASTATTPTSTSSPSDVVNLQGFYSLKNSLLKLIGNTKGLIEKIDSEPETKGGNTFLTHKTISFANNNNRDDSHLKEKIRKLMNQMKNLENHLSAINNLNQLNEERLNIMEIRITTLEEEIGQILKQFDDETRANFQQMDNLRSTLGDLISSYNSFVEKMEIFMEKQVQAKLTGVEKNVTNEEIYEDILYQRYIDAEVKLTKINDLARIEFITEEYLKKYSNVDYLFELIGKIKDFEKRIVMYNVLCKHLDQNIQNYSRYNVTKMIGNIKRELQYYLNNKLSCKRENLDSCRTSLKLTELSLRLLKLQWTMM